METIDTVEAKQLVEWGKTRGLLQQNPKLGEVWDTEFEKLPETYGTGLPFPEYAHLLEE